MSDPIADLNPFYASAAIVEEWDPAHGAMMARLIQEVNRLRQVLTNFPSDHVRVADGFTGLDIPDEWIGEIEQALWDDEVRVINLVRYDQAVDKDVPDEERWELNVWFEFPDYGPDVQYPSWAWSVGTFNTANIRTGRLAAGTAENTAAGALTEALAAYEELVSRV